jgi:hypothetical protein
MVVVEEEDDEDISSFDDDNDDDGGTNTYTIIQLFPARHMARSIKHEHDDDIVIVQAIDVCCVGLWTPNRLNACRYNDAASCMGTMAADTRVNMANRITRRCNDDLTALTSAL